MALLINQEIITNNKGILPHFYLKIETFNIDKLSGCVRVFSTPYTTGGDALSNSINCVMLETSSGGKFFSNLDYSYDLSKTIDRTITFNGSEVFLTPLHEFFLTKTVSVENKIYETVETEQQVTYYDFDENGNVIELTRNEMVPQKNLIGTEIVEMNEIDLSLLGSNPYNWMYSNLKKEYEKIFGEGRVLDV